MSAEPQLHVQPESDAENHFGQKRWDADRPDQRKPAGPHAVYGVQIALLTGGKDKPYALGMASALMAQGIALDFIGSTEVDSPELHDSTGVNYLNLRDQRPGASLLRKMSRVIGYYMRLIHYAAKASPKVFHILWNNHFDFFDRTVLMLYYKLLGKKILFTAHNVNAGQRDGNDSWLNRLTLRIQYRLVDHVFVHTDRMKQELMSEFGVPEMNVTVIPFGINNTLPNSDLTRVEARRALGLSPGEKVLLFFGNIAPYKGLEHLITALAELTKAGGDYRLIIAGKLKGCGEYWDRIQELIAQGGVRDQIIEKIVYIPDEQAELYFKAADVLVLPYKRIFQSGVLFLGYSFGLPVIAADVGSLREEIIEGKTGFVFRVEDAPDLATSIGRYFVSDLYRELDSGRRREIRDYANERYSWTKVAGITGKVYAKVLRDSCTENCV